MAASPPLRILIVEDEVLVARDLQHALERGGYRVPALCRTGEEAVEAVRRLLPDVILMDIHLDAGGMDGIEAAAVIRREFDKPVVFLTGHRDETTTVRARAAQPCGYLLKPFHESELRSVVELAVSRHLSDRRLQANGERFVSTLRSIAGGVISTDVLGVINFMNPVAEKLTGWPLEEAAGRPLYEVFRVSLPGGETLEPSSLVQGPGGESLRTMVLTDKDGQSISIEDNTTPIRDADGSLTGIVILFRRKEGVLTLPVPAGTGTPPWPSLAGIAGSISDPLVALDDAWRVTYVNQLAAEALGGTRESLPGTLLWDSLPESLYRRYYHEFSTAMVQRTARSFEMENEARAAWYEVQLYPFGSGLLALLRNITGRKVTEEQQNKLEKLESLGLLARGFAHDFNNLLTVLLGNLSLAEMNLPPENPGGEGLRTARAAAVQAQNLVQQLLTFARGGAPIRQPTGIGRLTQEWFAEWPKRPGLDYRLTAGSEWWQSNVDRHQIRRLLSNLMKNAEQATGSDGTITLRLLRPLQAGLEAPELGLPPETSLLNWVTIEMTDDGEGVSPENLPRLFEPYFTTRSDANASGLGLTVCESIARAHGGAIRLQSVWHEGTRVRVTLPAMTTPAATPAADPEPAPTAAPSPSPAPAPRLLVLEDEPLIRQLIIHNLQGAGCEVTATSDGAETVARFAEAAAAGRPYDLLVMDLSIPGGMGGAAAMEKIRELSPGVKAIVSSGYSDDPVMSRYADYGFSAVLPKPYQPQELRDMVRDLLAENR